MRGFREKRNRSLTYVRPRRNWTVYLPIPNVFISRGAAREKREYTRTKTKIMQMKNAHTGRRMDGGKNTEPKGTLRYHRPSRIQDRYPSLLLTLSLSLSLSLSLFLSFAADLQDDERCPEDTRAVRRVGKDDLVQERKKSLLNRVRAKVLCLQSPTRGTNRSSGPTKKKARTFNPVFHGWN